MRTSFLVALGVTLSVGVCISSAQDAPSPARYGVEANLESYPQGSAKETLASVISAIEMKRFDYLLAQLADPKFVDQRVKDVYGGEFEELVRETRSKFTDNPASVKELKRFLKEGEWENTEEDAAAVKLMDVKDRQVFMKKVGKRWYLENRQQSEK
jgi:hypothetical protein